MKVLVVEDNPASLELAEHLLEDAGFEVDTLSDGNGLVAHVLRTCPDVIVLDIQLPGADGLTLVAALREEPATARIPVIAFTAHAMKGDEARYLAAGCSSYLAWTNPWGLAFLPDGRMLVTERPGRMRIVGATAASRRPLAGVPEVHARGQGGLLDVVLGPELRRRPADRVLLRRADRAAARAPRWRVRGSTDGLRLDDVRRIFAQDEDPSGNHHWGSRLVFARDGTCSSPWATASTARATRRRSTAISARWCASSPTAACPPTTRSSGAADARPRSGPGAIATCRARRCIRSPASCGRTSTARRAATRSTARAPGATTAGR
jgi:CheY-like chemotaxis protein